MDFIFAPIFNQPISKIAPIPKIDRISFETMKDGYFLELNGENLQKDLVIWFGCFRTETTHRSQNVMFAKVPTWDAFNEQNKSVKIQTTSALISLIRESDGLVYPTNFHFVYSDLYIGKFGKVVSNDETELIDQIHDLDQFQEIENHPHQPPLNNSDPAIQLTTNANMFQQHYDFQNQGYNYSASIHENVYFENNYVNYYM
uniref:RBP-Jkappa IPT domain-containing protein n=1 Tax=Panagrolaimus sp. JU765 TaxID=591449 RepID=A0AC34QQ38_9BILA